VSARRSDVTPEAASGAPEGRTPLSEQVQGPLRAATEARRLTAGQLLTAEQLAERWQVPRAQVYRLSRTGQIPLVRLGRYFRYRLDAIETWEEGQENA
jgi:excisionase family DNA binding protein